MASLPVRTDRCRRWSKVSAPSVRVRTTRLAVVVVGLAMAAGMAILVHVFRESLLGELEVSAVSFRVPRANLLPLLADHDRWRRTVANCRTGPRGK